MHLFYLYLDEPFDWTDPAFCPEDLERDILGLWKQCLYMVSGQPFFQVQINIVIFGVFLCL